MPVFFKSVGTINFSCFWHQHFFLKCLILLEQVYHVDLRQAAWFSAIPWAVMAALGYVGGLCSDLLIQSGLTVTLTRKIMQVFLSMLASSCYRTAF